MPNNKYLLRLSNNNNTTGVSLNTDKDIFTIPIPNNLKGRGKCYVKVVWGMIQVEDVASGNRIVPANCRIAVVRSNIASLGYDTENNGSSNTILGTALIYANGDEMLELNTPTSGYVFTCPSLPDEIIIEKLCVDPADQLLTRANDYDTTSLPCSVTLELEFFEDFPDY